MATEWFIKDGSPVSVHAEDPNLALVGDYIPDWVLIPVDSPQRPGEKLRVEGHHTATCPKCRTRVTRILELEHNFRVSECTPGGCGYVFYTVQGDSE